jgi:hypothetical protein
MGSNYLPEPLANRWFIEFAIIEVVSEAISKKSHGKSTIEQQVWAVAIIK